VEPLLMIAFFVRVSSCWQAARRRISPLRKNKAELRQQLGQACFKKNQRGFNHDTQKQAQNATTGNYTGGLPEMPRPDRHLTARSAKALCGRVSQASTGKAGRAP
jgi:hypothetical protein